MIKLWTWIVSMAISSIIWYEFIVPVEVEGGFLIYITLVLMLVFVAVVNTVLTIEDFRKNPKKYLKNKREVVIHDKS